jgi:hypothetical protein
VTDSSRHSEKSVSILSSLSEGLCPNQLDDDRVAARPYIVRGKPDEISPLPDAFRDKKSGDTTHIELKTEWCTMKSQVAILLRLFLFPEQSLLVPWLRSETSSIGRQ